MMTERDREAAASTTRSSSVAAGRGTVKVRNSVEGVVYHLTFDGDLGRLTGAQLKQHVESIAGIPAARQTLSVNGHHMADATVGSTLGVRDGCVVLLETTPANTPVAREADSIPPAHDRAQSRGHSRSASGGTTSRPPPPPPPAREDRPPPRQATPPPAHDDELSDAEAELRRVEAEIAEMRRKEAELARRQRELREASERRKRGQAVVHHYHPGATRRGTDSDSGDYVERAASRPPPPSYHASGRPSQTASARRTPVGNNRSGVYDDSDVDVAEVEVEVEEEAGFGSAWLPSRSADIDEMRLQQQDYVWKMEQVRFETERMTREREMRRQQQELEYQAALLDRERVELERKTLLERTEFDDLQTQERADLDIEARYTPALLQYSHRAGSHSSAAAAGGATPGYDNQSYSHQL